MNSPFQVKKLNVPGVLDDGALQEQLKQFTDQQNSLQGAAPPPDSAVDFSKRVQDEYLKAPSYIRSAPAALPGPLGTLAGAVSTASQAGGESPQDEAIRVRSDIAAQALGSIPDSLRDNSALNATPLGAALQARGLLTQLGTLSPEEQQAEAEKRATDAAQAESALKDKIATHEKLRGLSDEDAAQLGLPVAPGGIDNATRDQLEAQDAEQLKVTEAKTKASEAAVTDKSKQPTQTWWLNAINSGVKGAAQVGTGTVKAPIIAWELTAGRIKNLGDIEKSDARAWVDTVDATLDKMLPGDKARAKDFMTQLSQGAGSMVGFMLGGYVASAFGMPASAATTMLGAATGADQQYEDAEQFGAVGLQKYIAFLAGGALGATEAIPIDRMLFRADHATGGLIRRMLNNTMAGSIEEFLQETGQAMGQDVVAKLLYDTSRVLDPASWLKQGAVGALSGGLAGASTVALHETGVTGQPQIEAAVKPAEREAMVLDAINTLQGAYERIAGIRNPDEALLGNVAPGQAAGASVVQGKGGTIPVNAQGQFEINHYSSEPLDTVSPAKMGTGPLRGQERQRLSGGEDVVPRSYFGVGDPEFSRRFAEDIAKLPPRLRPFKQDTDPYHGEGLGPYRHTVAVDPNTVYNIAEDVLDLRSKLDATAPASERVTRLEKLVRDAGFDGIYYPRTGLGQTAMMFTETSPVARINQTTGLNEKFTVPDINAVPVSEQETAPLPGLSTGKPVKKVVQAARAYAQARGIPVRRQAEYVKADPERGRRIAAAYEAMKHQPNNPKVKAAYKAMIDETLAQYQFVKATGLKIEAIEPGQKDPYPEGPKQVLADLERGHLWFFPTESGFGGDLKNGEFTDRTGGTELQYTVHNGAIEVLDLSTPPRERGHGQARQLMEKLVSRADAAGATVRLMALPDEDTSLKKLLAFYGSLGFKRTGEVDDGGVLMERAPSAAANRSDNPLLAPTNEKIGDRTLLVNDVFRIVHDFFGHGIEGSGFGARGEENAWQSHMRLYSQAALPAVTSETRGQNSWVNFGPHGESNRSNQRETIYADQKTGIMPAWTWQEGVADEAGGDLLANMVAPERVAKLLDQVPGLKGVSKYLTPDEQGKLSKRNAETIVDIFTNLPDPKEMAVVAVSGRAKRGWYKRSAEALVDIFGLTDAPRFAGLLAALSPQTSVESNAVNALTTWANWIKAGRPTTRDRIVAILGQSVQGGKGEASVLPAWINNAVTALTAPDATNIVLSGPKVDSFMRNLQGHVIEVTNDAWMANFANVDQTLFAKSGAAPGKGPGYVAMSAAVRAAADTATKLTGEVWTPAEIQETVWSWAKTLYEKASAAGENRTAEQIVKAGDMTADEISATPDFASLFVSGVYKKLLEKGGYDVERLAERSQSGNAGDTGRGQPLSAEGTGIAQRTFDQHVRRAARRLDLLRARRAEEANAGRGGETFSLDDTFFPTEDGAQKSIGALTDEDMDFIEQGLLANQGTAGGRGPLKGEPTRPATGVETPQGAENVDVSLSQISRNLIDLMDLTARQGRIAIKTKGALGQYSRKQDVIRVKTWNDLSTIVHEAGHALYFDATANLKTYIAGNDQRLMDVATALYGGDVNTLSKANHIAEGFAEFFRIYVTNRAYAERKYPDLTRDFTDVLERDAPQLKQGLDIIGQQFAAWLQLPSVQLVRNMIVPGTKEEGINAALKELRDTGFGTWMQEYNRKTVDGLLNRYSGVNSIVRDILNVGQENTGKAIDLKRADDPRVLIRLAQNAGARAMVQTTDGVMGYHSVEPFTRGLREALLLSQGLRADQNLGTIDPVRRQDFAAYLVALRGIDEYRRFAEGKIERPPLAATLGDLQVTVKELDAKYPDNFRDAAQIVHEYGMGLWQKSYDAGLMSEETYKDGLERQFYAPLQRDMSDKKASLGASALTSGASIVKRFRGSDRDIVDPMDVLMHKTFSLEQIINKNDVMVALGRLADRAGKVGALVERVPAQQLIGKQFSVQEIARQLTKDDTVSATDAQDLMEILQASIENDNVLSLFRSEQASTKGENIVFYWDKGRLAALQLQDGDVGADVVNTMNGIGRENMPMFVNLIAATSTAFRTSITSWPDFLITNFIRDQLSAFILTDIGYKPFVTGLRGTFDELRQRQWARQYNAAMGIMGGMNVAALHDAKVNRDINALRKKGYLPRAFSGGGLLGAVKGLSRVVELTETGTRVGIFKAAYTRAKADGLSDWDASIEASYTATDYIDFGLNGSRMLIFRKTIPFLNAQLQGLYKMMRTLGGDEVRQRKGLRFVLGAYFKNINGLDLSRNEKQALQTGRKAWIKMASLGFISAALNFLFEDDPDYQEAGEYLRTTGWVIPMGDGRLFYIPKPFELALVANFVERGIESASGDPQAKFRFMRGLAMTMTPPTSPPAIQTAVELAANKDFFTGREIVPSYMQALQPQLQYDNYTTELAKNIGAATGLSPMIVDHVLSGLGASAYRDLTSMYNNADPNRPAMQADDAPILRRFIRDVRKGSVSSRDFWKIASTVDGSLRSAEVSYKDYIDQGNERAADEFLNSLDEDERAYALLATHFKADAKRLNPFYRARQLTTIVSGMRREMVSNLGLEDTTTKFGGSINLSATEKARLDDALSEYARREMRNTLVAERAPGWGDKRIIDTQPTIDLIGAIDPRVQDELQRRIAKAKVYTFDTVNDYWPEVKDRLIRDRENTFLKDILTIAKVAR